MSNTMRDRLPIERYLEIRYADGAASSHDDHSVFFLTNITGIPQLWNLEEGTPWPRQITFFQDRVTDVHVHSQKDLVCISSDLGGTENTQLYITDQLGEVVENITNDTDHMYVLGAWKHGHSSFIYSSNVRTGRHFDVYEYDLTTRKQSLILASDHTNYAVAVSNDDRSILISRNHTSLHNELFLFDLQSQELTCLTKNAGEGLFHSAFFSKDGRFVYCLSSIKSEFMRIVRIELENGYWEYLSEDKWDVNELGMSHDGSLLAYAVNEKGGSQLFIKDAHSPESQAVCVSDDFPPGVISHLRWRRARQSFVFTLSSPRYATEVWEYYVPSQKLNRMTYSSISGVSSVHFVEPEAVTYASFDGLDIPAFYYKPEGHGPHPVIVYVHGGPESQTRNSFNSVIQYFVQEGFAVFAPNVRGSTGLGMTYMNMDNKQKRMDSVADLAKGVEWLVTKGDAKRDAIAVMGGSYGGFMVLAALTHYPELWAAGVDLVGIANLRTFIEKTSPYRRHLRESEYGTIAEDGEFFDAISPIFHVDKIVAPLMIIHGANDPRVPVSEAEQIVSALKARNHPVQYLRFEDEGHGIIKLKNRQVAYPQIAEFLRRHLELN